MSTAWKRRILQLQKKKKLLLIANTIILQYLLVRLYVSNVTRSSSGRNTQSQNYNCKYHTKGHTEVSVLLLHDACEQNGKPNLT